MQQLLVDTSVLVEYFKNGGGILGSILDSYELYCSPISYTELLAGKRAANAAVAKQIADFISQKMKVVPITDTTAKSAASILREQEITLAHALIAAAAIEKDIPLLTYDLKVFDQIPNLKLVDL